MPFKSVLVERLYLVRWNVPQPADVDVVLAEVRQAHQQLGPPILALAIVPEDTPPPDAAMRKLMGQKLPPLIECAESLYYVMEGDGFKNSILRSVATNVILLAGKRSKIFVHKSVEEAFAAMGPRLRELNIALPRVRMAALNKGILRARPGDRPASRI